MKPGYLYVLIHPSDPSLVKIGHTTGKPEHALAKHNNEYKGFTGQVVEETSQLWELKEYIAVPDPAYSKTAFWETMHRFGSGDVRRMKWEWVQMCLNEAKKVGVRPPLSPEQD